MKKRMNIFTMLRILTPKILRFSPGLFFLSAALFLIHGLSYVFIPITTKIFFDEAERVAGSGISVFTLLPLLVLMASSYIFNKLIDAVSNFATGEYANKASGLISFTIHQKMSKLPPVYFEDNEKLNLINKAEAGKANAVGFLINVMLTLFFYAPYIIFISWFLFQLQPILVAAIIAAFIPPVIEQIFRARLFREAEDESVSLRRQYEHYEQCICGREFFAETRHLGAFGYFFNLCKRILSEINRISLKASNKSNLFGLCMQTLTAATYIAVWVIAFFMVLNGQISIGAFAAVLASLDDIYALMFFVIAWNLTQLSKGFGSIENYIQFINLPELGGDSSEIEVRESIVFDNVSFSYPGAKQQAVSNVSFRVNPKETIAVVGENGSGKTTLMRLLMGIYTPDSGSVRFDSKDIADYSLNAVSKNISAVFQRYMRYQISLSDNITISRYSQKPDKAMIERAVQMAGVDIEDEILTERYDTVLSREFGGIDVSGGQWQRIAVARGYYRKHSLIVLDEPTSAIDPLEETKIYERFIDMSKDKTAFIVTHRLGSVRRADRIFVMDKGKLAESGVHEELIANNNIYAQMYNMQKKRYE